MRALLQRVHSASVMVGTEVVSQIASGWLILLGIATNDTELQARLLSNKIKELRAKYLFTLIYCFIEKNLLNLKK